MAKTWMTSISIIFSGLACTEQPSDYRGRTAQEASPSGELDVAENQTPGPAAPSSGANPTPSPTPVTTSTPAPPAPLNEIQALALR